jgi:hypothetical protein
MSKLSQHLDDRNVVVVPNVAQATLHVRTWYRCNGQTYSEVRPIVAWAITLDPDPDFITADPITPGMQRGNNEVRAIEATVDGRALWLFEDTTCDTITAAEAEAALTLDQLDERSRARTLAAAE